MKILIADDEMPLAKALSLKLSKSGFDVKSVSNGEETLTELRNTKYDVLLLDLIMPVMNGFEVLEALAAEGLDKELKIFVLSNLGQTEDIEKTKRYGIVEYIVKSNSTLADIVNMIETKAKS